jgi:hypothetical protein
MSEIHYALFLDVARRAIRESLHARGLLIGLSDLDSESQSLARILAEAALDRVDDIARNSLLRA